jgi:hypothetical protein
LIGRPRLFLSLEYKNNNADTLARAGDSEIKGKIQTAILDIRPKSTHQVGQA